MNNIAFVMVGFLLIFNIVAPFVITDFITKFGQSLGWLTALISYVIIIKG